MFDIDIISLRDDSQMNVPLRLGIRHRTLMDGRQPLQRLRAHCGTRGVITHAALIVGRLIMGAAAAFALTTQTSASSSIPPAGLQEFAIHRDGSPIGSYRATFVVAGERLLVEVDITVEINLAFITVYRFEHKRREVWQNGQLIELETRIDDDGAESHVLAHAGAEGLEVDGPAGRIVVPRDIVPSGYWNAATVGQTRLLDSEDGVILNIQISGGELETIAAGEREIRARHYRITGDLEKDVWYDEAGVWVGLSFSARDGSKIEYILN